MIFIYWHLFILLEAVGHGRYILAGNDPTPDDKFFAWSKVAVISIRLLVFLVFWWVLGDHKAIEFWCYFAGALFSHLLIFPLLINFMMSKPLDYLGKGPVDSVLKLLPPLARWWFLLVLEVAAIYTYFNPDLL